MLKVNRTIGNISGNTSERTGRKAPKNSGGFAGGLAYVGASIGAGVGGIAEGLIDVLGAAGNLVVGNVEGAKDMFRNDVVGDWYEGVREDYNPGGAMSFIGDVAHGLGQSATLFIPVAGVPLFYTGIASQGISGAAAKTGDVGFKEIAYGATSAAIEGVVDKALGGTATAIGNAVKGVGKGASRAGKTIFKATTDATRKGLAKTLLSSAAGEFGEEFISEYADTILQRTYQIDPNASTSLKDAIYAGAVGAVSGALSMSVATVPRSINFHSKGESIIKRGNSQTLVNTATKVADRLAAKGTSFKDAAEWVTALRGQVDAYNDLVKKGKGESASAKTILGEMQAYLYFAETKAAHAGITERIMNAGEEDRAALAEYINMTVKESDRPRSYTAEDVKNNTDEIASQLAIMEYAGVALNYDAIKTDEEYEREIEAVIAEESGAKDGQSGTPVPTDNGQSGTPVPTNDGTEMSPEFAEAAARAETVATAVDQTVDKTVAEAPQRKMLKVDRKGGTVTRVEDITTNESLRQDAKDIETGAVEIDDDAERIKGDLRKAVGRITVDGAIYELSEKHLGEISRGVQKYLRQGMSEEEAITRAVNERLVDIKELGESGRITHQVGKNHLAKIKGAIINEYKRELQGRAKNSTEAATTPSTADAVPLPRQGGKSEENGEAVEKSSEREEKTSKSADKSTETTPSTADAVPLPQKGGKAEPKVSKSKEALTDEQRKERARKRAERIIEWEKENAPSVKELNRAREYVKDFDNLSPERRQSIIRMLRSADGIDEKTVKGIANLMAIKAGADLEIRFDDKVSEYGLTATIGDKTLILVSSKADFKKTVKGTVAHELVHYLEKKPGYKTFAEQVMKRVKPEVREKVEKDVTARYNEHYKVEYRSELEKQGLTGKKLDKALADKLASAEHKAMIDSEVTAELVGQALNNDKFLSRYARIGNTDGFIKKAWSFLRSMVKELKSKGDENNELADIIMPTIRSMDRLLRMGNSLIEKSSSKKYELGYTTQNRAVAIIKDDIFQGKFDELSEKERVQIVKTAIKSFRPGIPISGKLISVSRKTVEHFIGSNYTDSLRNHDTEMYEDKLQISQNIDDVIYASTNYINEGLLHQRDDNIIEFARGSVLLDIGAKKYEAKVLVGYTTMKELLLYDIQDMVPTNFTIKTKRTQPSLAGNKSDTRKTAVSSTNSIPQKSDLSTPSTKKYSLAPKKAEKSNENDEVKKKITIGMSDSERAEVLENTSLEVVKFVDENADLSSKEVLKLKDTYKSQAEKIVRDLAKKFGVFTDYSNENIDLEFNYSSRSLGESVHKQNDRVLDKSHADFSDFAKMLYVFDDVVKCAQPIEAHSDKYVGTKRANSNLKQTYILLSAFEEGKNIVPVEFNIKEFSNGDKNKLYVSVTLQKIEVDLMEHPPQLKTATKNSKPTSTYSITDILKNVNPHDKYFLKYIPDSLLDYEQIKAKIEALEEDRIRLDDMRYEYAVENNPDKANEMLSEKAKAEGYTIDSETGTVYKSGSKNDKTTEITYDDDGKLIPISKRYDDSVADKRYSLAPKKAETDGKKAGKKVDANEEVKNEHFDKATERMYERELATKDKTVKAYKAGNEKLQGKLKATKAENRQYRKDNKNIIKAFAEDNQIKPITQDEVKGLLKRLESYTNDEFKILFDEVGGIGKISVADREQFAYDLYVGLNLSLDSKDVEKRVANIANRFAKAYLDNYYFTLENGKREYLRDSLDEETYGFYVKFYGRKLISSFKDMGSQTTYGRLKAYYRAENKKLRINLFDAQNAGKAFREVLYQARKLKTDVSIQKRDPKDAGIMAVEKEMSKIVNERGQMSVKQADKAFALFNEFLLGSQEKLEEGLTEFAHLENSSLIDMLQAYLHSRKDRSKKPLNATEMKLAGKILAGGRKILNEYNKEYINGHWVDAEAAAKDCVADLTADWRDKEYKNKVTAVLGKAVGAIQEKYFYKILTPETVVETLEGFSKNGLLKSLYHSIRVHKQKAEHLAVQMKKPLAEFLDSKENRYTDDKGISHSFRTKLNKKMISVDGANGVVDLTLGEAIYLYMLTKRAPAHAGLLEEGYIVFDDKNQKRAKLRLTDIEVTRNNIYNQLDATDIEFLKMAESFFNETASKIKYDADMNIFGYTNNQDGYYVPMIRDRYGRMNGVTDVRQSIGSIATVYNKSFTKNLVANAKALEGKNIMSIINDHADGLADYSELYLPLKAFDRIYNKAVATKDGSVRSIREVLNNDVWNGTEQYFKDLFADIQGQRKHRDDVVNNIVGKLRSGWVNSVLGANLKVVTTQTTSLVSATQVIGAKYITKCSYLASPGKLPGLDELRERAYKYSDIIEARSFDMGALKAQGNIDKVSALGEKAGWAIGWMDERICLAVFHAAELQVQDQKGFEIGSEENARLAGKLADEAIYTTQAMSSASERSALQRSESEIGKMFAMFTSDTVKNLSHLYGNIMKWNAYRMRNNASEGAYEAELKQAGKDVRRSIRTLAATGIMLGLITQAFKYLYGREEEDPEDKNKDLIADVAGSTLNILPIASDVIDKIVFDYDMSINVLDVANDTLDSLGGTFKMVGRQMSGEYVPRNEIIEKSTGVFKSVASVFGVPISPFERTVTGLIRFVPGGEKLAYGYNDIFGNPSYTADLKAAVESGDAELAEYVLEKLYESEMSGVYTSEEIGEIVRLYSLTDESGKHYNVLPQRVPEKLDDDTKMSAAQRKQFNKIYSQSSAKVNELIRSDYYAALDDSAKAKAISNVYGLYFDSAKAQVMGKDWSANVAYTHLTGNVTALMASKAYKSGLKEYKDERGTTVTVKEQFAEYIKGLELSKEDQLVFAYANGYKGKATTKSVLKYINSLGLSADVLERIARALNLEVKDGAIAEKTE